MLGIDLDRITAGRPSENGRHERMHRDIAHEVERHKAGGLKSQIAALEVWRKAFNRERPHEALGMRCPAEVYRRSSRLYRGTPDRLQYPDGSLQRRVNSAGCIRIEGVALRISYALTGWDVGLRPVVRASYSVHFGRLCLGLLDGSALTHWNDIVRAHGGNPDPVRLPRPRRTVVALAPRGGFVAAVAAGGLGWTAVQLGAGRRRQDDRVDAAAGVQVHGRVGDRVDAGQPSATLEVGERAVNADGLAARAAAAVVIAEEAPAGLPIVIVRLGGAA